MKQLVKNCFTLVLVTILIISNLIIAQAEAIEKEHPVKAINTPKGKVECSMTNTGTVKISATVKTVFGANTKMTVYLQKYNAGKNKWTSIKTWTKSSSNATTILESTYNLSKKGTYRAKMTADVIRNSKSETIQVTSNSKKYV